MRARWPVMVSAIAVLLVSGAAFRPDRAAAADPACNRVCLNGFVDQYLAALAARDPSRLPVTGNIRFTEDSAPLKLGDGLWQTVTGVGTYRIYCDEPEAGEVGSIDVIEENKLPAILMLRLKVVDHKISEVETILVRSTGEANQVENAHTENLTTSDPLWEQDVPASKRPSREEMIATVSKYFDGIEQINGKIIPYADNGYRILNGTLDCNDSKAANTSPANISRFGAMTCPDQIDTGAFSYTHSIRPRRFPVVDREKGLVLTQIRFNHPGNLLTLHLSDGGTVDMTKSAWGQHPTSALMAELFKVENGKIRLLFGVYTKVPYKNPVGWDGE